MARRRSYPTPEQIKAARAMAGLTVEQLADEARTSRQTLWRWCEHGKTPVWSIREDVQAVLEEYGVVFLPKTKDHGPGVAMALPETDG